MISIYWIPRKFQNHVSWRQSSTRYLLKSTKKREKKLLKEKKLFITHLVASLRIWNIQDKIILQSSSAACNHTVTPESSHTSSTQAKQQNNGASRLSSLSLTFPRTNHIYGPLLVILLGCFCLGCSVVAAKQECQGICFCLYFRVFSQCKGLIYRKMGLNWSIYIHLVFMQSTSNISFRSRKASVLRL